MADHVLSRERSCEVSKLNILAETPYKGIYNTETKFKKFNFWPPHELTIFSFSINVLKARYTYKNQAFKKIFF